MTTDNGAAAAVAEPEVTTQDESASIGTESPAADSGSAAAPAAAAAAIDAGAEGSPEAEPDDSFDPDKFIAAKLGTPTEEPEKPKPAYGKTQAEVELAAFNQLRTTLGGILQGNDLPIQEYLREMGVEPDVASRLWKEKLRPLVQNAANLPQVAVNQLFAEDLQQALQPEDYAGLWDKETRYENRGAVLKQVVANAEARVNKDWESKKGKEWVPVKVFKEGIEEAVTKAQARFDKQVKDGTYQSGQNAQGKASSNGRLDLSTKSKARNAHAQGKIDNNRMREINADPSIPEN